MAETDCTDKNKSNKLIITRQNKHIVSSLFYNREMIQVNLNPINEESILGNIYVGKVKNIVKNINAAFVEIEKGLMCYLSLEKKLSPIFINHKKNSNIVAGDELLVQVSKENVKSKAPVVTTNINFTGKYVVLVHGNPFVGISSKISDRSQREHLKALLNEYKNDVYGFIIRTNATTACDNQIRKEVELLRKVYEEIVTYSIYKNIFSLIYETPPGYLCDIRDGFADNLDEIVTDDSLLFESIKAYLKTYQPEDLSKLRFYEDSLITLSNLYRIKGKLDELLREKVWLKSGGSIIIQPTEALTVIDVNTEKAIGGKKRPEETFFRINKEASREIAKQIRLRNLSGIIIIDFIDMEKQEHKDMLMKELRGLFSKDPIKTVLVDMTALNLVEVTRKKVRKPLYEQISDK